MRSDRLSLTLLTVAVAACGGGTGSTGPSAAVSPSATTSASTELVADLDVGGRTMHLVCVGPTDTGEPTILIEAGGAATTHPGARSCRSCKRPIDYAPTIVPGSA